MSFLSLIEAKRDGGRLSEPQIATFVRDFTAGIIPDYQMAAMLMAIYFRSLDKAETRALTLAMRDSGDVLSFPKDSRPLVDKHSTGGVGDKVSLPLAPLLACLGFRVPMISGRGLGITGGTLDKLESIPGFKTILSLDAIVEQVQTIGCVICGQTKTMVPADKVLYALRDVTATVPSIPLITASILSKKLAESLDALVLDVKFGSAAFMQTEEQARELANAMVALGKECGVNCRALLTNMDVPLGRAAGNWLEVKESVACLKGEGGDLTDLVIECAAHLLLQTRCEQDLNSARKTALKSLGSGEPLKKFEAMLVAQGTHLEQFRQKLECDTTASVVTVLKAERGGVIETCNARIVGEIVRDLGGGRLTKESVIDPAVGIDQLRKPGETVKADEILARIHAANEQSAANAVRRLTEAFTLTDEPTELPPLVQEVIG